MQKIHSESSLISNWEKIKGVNMFSKKEFFFLVAIVSCLVSRPLFADVISTNQAVGGSAVQTAHIQKIDDIHKLLEATHVHQLMDQMLAQMFGMIKQQIPENEVPAGIWDSAAKELKSDEAIERIVPIYDKYYTDQDIKGLLAFYESPLGQKVVQTTPQVMKESMAIGQRWGQEAAERMLKKLNQQRKKKNVQSE